VLSAFHEDALDNHSGVEELAVERFPKAIARANASLKSSSHSICNEMIQVDGDVANSESYLIAYNRIGREGRDVDWIFGARFVDRFERRRGSWRIAHRTVVFDWQRFDEVRDPPEGLRQVTSFDRSEHGTRAPNDYSYERLDL
jgi:hypothetical protein